MLTRPHAPFIRRLSAAALALFALLALLLWLIAPEAHPFVATATLSLGALLVALLSGIQWGLALKGDSEQATASSRWGMTLIALAWVATLMPPFAGLPVLGLLHVGSYLIDRKLWPALGLSDWMMLRFRFAAIATLCCVVGAAAT